MGFVRYKTALVLGTITTLFGWQMYSVGGYGVMEPYYRGMIYLGIGLFLYGIYRWMKSPSPSEPESDDDADTETQPNA